MRIARLSFFPLAFVSLVWAGCGSENAQTPDRDPTGGGFDDDSFAPAGLGDLAACATSSTKGNHAPANLVFMFDRSDSMFTENAKAKRWDPVVAAMTLFFEDAQSAGMEASLTYFPDGFNGAEECSAATYEKPHVPLATLPSAAFAASLREQTGRKNSTPTRAALTGAIEQAKGIRASRPGTRTAIVFITDGQPRTCGVGDEEGDKAELRLSEDAARAVAAQSPTFVVGVGANLTAFHGLASAGGTERATLVDDTESPEAIRDAFREALGLVRARTGECSFELPAAPDGKRLDVNLVNVVFTPSGGQPRTLLYDRACSSGGWRYDDPVTPTRLDLCQSTCDEVRAGDGGDIAIAFGCATKGDLK